MGFEKKSLLIYSVGMRKMNLDMEGYSWAGEYLFPPEKSSPVGDNITEIDVFSNGYCWHGPLASKENCRKQLEEESRGAG